MFALRCDSREGIWVGELIFVDRWSLGKWQEASCLTPLGPVTTSCRLQVHMNNIHVTYCLLYTSDAADECVNV